jgi:hypothetical protein
MATTRREILVQTAKEEFGDLDLGDKRRNARGVEIASKIAMRPRASFPDSMRDDAELEAFYRFTSNEDITYDAILEPHIEATTRRCESAGTVLAIHDMSEAKFSGDRDGLMEVGESSTFWALYTLAVRPSRQDGDVPMPLGLLGLHPFLSNRGAKGIMNRGKSVKKDSRAARYNRPRFEKESFLWDIGALTAVQNVGPDVQVIHVADQECDDYAFLSLLVEDGMRFVIRGDPKRRALDSDEQRAPAKELLEQAPHKFTREVLLSSRPHSSGSHAKRRTRPATLHVRAMPLTFKATKAAAASLAEIVVNVVHIFEPNPPAGEDAIEWLLYTSEPIATAEDLRFIVDAYCARWLIEEFFKAIKTGCAYEARQLGSGHALLNVLALCIPISWRMLMLRNLARSAQASDPATDYLSLAQIELLRLLRPKAKLGKSPTTREALLAIASLGGHLKNNGDPGWLTLWRGYRELLEAHNLARQLQHHGNLAALDL